MSARKVAVALLVAENEGVLAAQLPIAYLFADILEAREGLHGLNPAVGGDRRAYAARHYGLDYGGVGGDIFFEFQYKIGQQSARLVAREQGEALARLNAHTHTVAVGVGADDNIRPLCLGLLYGEQQSVMLLRIRRANGGEFAVRQLLSRHDGDILIRQNAPDGDIARAVQRGINYPEIAFFAVKAQLFDLAEECLKGLLADIGQPPRLLRFIERHKRDAAEVGDGVDIADKALGIIGHELAAL